MPLPMIYVGVLLNYLYDVNKYSISEYFEEGVQYMVDLDNIHIFHFGSSLRYILIPYSKILAILVL